MYFLSNLHLGSIECWTSVRRPFQLCQCSLTDEPLTQKTKTFTKHLTSEILRGDCGKFEAVWFFLKRKAQVNKATGLTVDWWPRVQAAFSQRKERNVAPHQFWDISFSRIYILHNFLASKSQPSWSTYTTYDMSLLGARGYQLKDEFVIPFQVSGVKIKRDECSIEWLSLFTKLCWLMFFPEAKGEKARKSSFTTPYPHHTPKHNPHISNNLCWMFL